MKAKEKNHEVVSVEELAEERLPQGLLKAVLKVTFSIEGDRTFIAGTLSIPTKTVCGVVVVVCGWIAKNFLYR